MQIVWSISQIFSLISASQHTNKMTLSAFPYRVCRVRHVAALCLCLVCCPFLIEAHWFWLLCVGLCCAFSSIRRIVCTSLHMCVSASVCVCVCMCMFMVLVHWTDNSDACCLIWKLRQSLPDDPPRPALYKHRRRKAIYDDILLCTICEARW